MTDRRSTAGALAALVAMAALVAGACGGSTATPQTILVTPAPTPSPVVVVTQTAGGTTAPPPGPTEVPVAGASWAVTPSVIDSIQTEGGKSPSCSTWTVTMHKPIVTGVSSAAAMNAAIGALVNGYVADFKTHLGEGGGAGQCTLEGDFTVGIASQTLVTIAFANQTYLGGASTGSTVGSLNFISPTGATIAFNDLFTDSSAAATILSTQSRTLLAAGLGSSAAAATIAAGTTPDMANFNKAWVLAATGLQVTFAQNQVGAASLGTPVITIPWAALASVLNGKGAAGQFFTGPASSPSAS